MTEPVALAFIALITLLIKIWWDLRKVHQSTNSRLDQLLKSHGQTERETGRKEGRKEGREEGRKEGRKEEPN